MSATVAEVIGALISCGAAGAALVVRDPRQRYAAIGVALFAAVALIGGEVWDQERFEDLRDQPAALGLALILGAIALGATASTFVRAPVAFVVAVFAVISLRVPVQVGGETNFLLLPLYGVIAGGWLRGVWLLKRGRGEDLRQPGSPRADEPPVVRWLTIALAVSLVVYALGIAWSDDPTNGLRNVAFFLAPFAALMALLRDVRWYRKLVGWCFAAFALVALAFAALAIWQYGTRELLLNKDLEDANQLHLYFRANSLFRDPNVFGRYLVFAVIAVGAWMAWQRPRREALLGALVAAALLVALAFTYSQTSMVALVTGVGALVWFRLGARGLGAAIVMGAVALAAFVAIGGAPESTLDKKRDDLGDVSSGREGLISGGWQMFTEAPFAGKGSGGFAQSFIKDVEPQKRPISHTEPITVAAEQGLLGLIPYVAVVALALVCLLVPWPAIDPIRAAIAACFLALLVHSLGYAGFPIDPATWVLLGLGVALRE